MQATVPSAMRSAPGARQRQREHPTLRLARKPGPAEDRGTMKAAGWAAAVLLAMGWSAAAQGHPAGKQSGKHAAAQPAKAAPLEMAITFDDLPAHGPLPAGETREAIAERVVKTLRQFHVPPTYGFVNAVEVLDHPELVNVLGTWRGAGDLLGNHTWSHMNLNQHSLEQFEGDVSDDEPALRLMMYGQDWHWLRFPYLAEGDTAQKRMGVRAWLAQHGYRIAAVTMSFDDYEWNQPYARCVGKHAWKSVGWLEASYLRAAEENIGYDRSLSKQLYGHDIPYVLLLHIGAFDARMLPRLLAMYREHGFTFVPLRQAEEDPFYRYAADPKLLPGPDSLESAMAQQHRTLPKQTDYSRKLDALCK